MIQRPAATEQAAPHEDCNPGAIRTACRPQTGQSSPPQQCVSTQQLFLPFIRLGETFQRIFRVVLFLGVWPFIYLPSLWSLFLSPGGNVSVQRKLPDSSCTCPCSFQTLRAEFVMASRLWSWYQVPWIKELSRFSLLLLGFPGYPYFPVNYKLGVPQPPLHRFISSILSPTEPQKVL